MPKAEKIVVKTVNRPTEENTNALTDWFFDAFDLSGKGDSQEREMFKEIINNTFKGVGTTSKQLSMELKLPRSTAIYYLNKFISSGLIVRKGRRYYLRANDLTSTIQELQAEMQTEFNRMMQLANKLDELMEGEIYGERKKGNR
jgi:predicted transcriptional regulator